MNAYLHGNGRTIRFAKHNRRWVSLAPWYWVTVDYLDYGDNWDRVYGGWTPATLLSGIDPTLLKTIIRIDDRRTTNDFP